MIPHSMLYNLLFLFTTLCLPVCTLQLSSDDSFDGIELERASIKTTNYTTICGRIARSISGHKVHYPGSIEYESLLRRYAESARLWPACAVGPESTMDVGQILRIVGRTRTPFAVQGGGHSPNVGFSSTTGVHISLSSFRSISYNTHSKTVDIGTGLRWYEVYEALAPHGRNVLGGRVPEVGVPGFLLGGGYAFMTNQYGLGLDHIVAFELVEPSGKVVTVSQRSDPALFFGLKGGFNNFGIVTKISMKTFPQGPVWGANVIYTDASVFSEVFSAFAALSSEIVDPKVTLLGQITIGANASGDSVGVHFVYDGPNPPPNLLDSLSGIPASFTRNSTESFVELVARSSIPQAGRTIIHTVAVPAYSENFINFVYNVSQLYRSKLSSQSLTGMYLTPEPFLPDILSHNTSPSAYPFTRQKMYTPFPVGLAWSDPKDDATFIAAARDMAKELEDFLVVEGHPDVRTAPLYPNYALADTPVTRLYGSNLPKMRRVKKRVDPENVMGLAGGFKI